MQDHYRKLAAMYAGANSQAGFTTQIKICEGSASLVLPVRDEYKHAANAVHGYVYFKLMDDAAFFAAASLVTDNFVLTSSFNLFFLRPVSEGKMHASAKVVSRSPSLLIADAVILNDKGREVGRGTGTFLKVKSPSVQTWGIVDLIFDDSGNDAC